jgi:hypothetical protein
MLAHLSLCYSFLVYRSTPASVQSLCLTAMNAEIYLMNQQQPALLHSALDLKICSPYYKMLRWENEPDTSELSDIAMETLRQVHLHKAQEQRKLLEHSMIKNQKQDEEIKHQQQDQSYWNFYRGYFLLEAVYTVVILTIYFLYCLLELLAGFIRMILIRCCAKFLQIWKHIFFVLFGEYLLWTIYVYIVMICFEIWSISTLFYRIAANVLQAIDFTLQLITRFFAIMLGILERFINRLYVFFIRLVKLFLLLSAFAGFLFILSMSSQLQESFFLKVLISGLISMLVVEYFEF